jgi:hypothetical protein
MLEGKLGIVEQQLTEAKATAITTSVLYKDKLSKTEAELAKQKGRVTAAEALSTQSEYQMNNLRTRLSEAVATPRYGALASLCLPPTPSLLATNALAQGWA